MSEAVGRRRPVLVGARDDRLLDPGEALGDVFAEEAGRSLLVLGEPGSGKSVLLRHLARELLERPGAEAEPIPVLLDLAGWTADGRLFIEWLASEDGLRRSYRSISDAQLRAWLHDGHLTLLLDGLDEVRAEQRAACVEAINAFIGGAGGGAPGGLVVCCRVDEYHVIAREVGPLDLGAAIYLQPLTEAQVGRYLDTAGPHAGGLRAAWEADEAVRELARNPLMLRTMSLAFGRSGGEAGHAAVGPGLRGEALRKHLLDAYVGRVFERAEVRVQRREDPDALPESGLPVPEGERVFEGDPAWASGAREALPFERAEVVRRLGWLAVRLREHARSTFYVEELQPSWLSARQRGPYVMLSRGAGGVLLGLTAGALLLLGLAGLLTAGLHVAAPWRRRWTVALHVGLVLAIVERNGLAVQRQTQRRCSTAAPHRTVRLDPVMVDADFPRIDDRYDLPLHGTPLEHEQLEVVARRVQRGGGNRVEQAGRLENDFAGDLLRRHRARTPHTRQLRPEPAPGTGCGGSRAAGVRVHQQRHLSRG